MAEKVKLHPKYEAQAEMIAEKAITRMEKHFVSKAEALRVIITVLIAIGLFLFARPDLQEILKGKKYESIDIKRNKYIAQFDSLWK